MRGLYPIVDVDALAERGLDPLAFAVHVLAARPPLLQLRAKHAAARETVDLLRALAPLCRAAGALLFGNDRPDVALVAGCDGIHVGQDDLAVSDVRAFAPQLKVGVSTHDLDQLALELEARPDYVAFGPVFSTRSKREPDPLVGVKLLARAHALAQARAIPLVAIGGIDRARAAEIRGHCELAAVIAALLPERGELAQATEHARALSAALG